MSDLAAEVRLLRLQLGELARIMAPQGYPYDPAVQDPADSTAPEAAEQAPVGGDPEPYITGAGQRMGRAEYDRLPSPLRENFVRYAPRDLGPASEYPSNIGDTCCGSCPGGTCYVDQLTGERP